jgi:hypothetical protein
MICAKRQIFNFLFLRSAQPVREKIGSFPFLIFCLKIIKSVPGNNLNDRKSLVIENAYGNFPPGNEFFNEYLFSIAPCS